MQIWDGQHYKQLLDAAEKKRVPVAPSTNLMPFVSAVALVMMLLLFGMAF